MGDKPVDLDHITLDADTLGLAAKEMCREIITDYSRGVGDTVPAAAGRAGRDLQVEVEILLQGWSRPAREMYASRWMRLFMAWRRHRSRKQQGWTRSQPSPVALDALEQLARCLSSPQSEEGKS